MPRPNQAADRKPIVCPICQKSFCTVYYKKAHMLVVHENAGRLRCGHCNKTFQSETHLKSHENVHTGEKSFGCKDCGKRLTTNGHLKVHELDNHVEKKFKCPHPQCDMAFGREGALKKHLVTHSTEKPFQCDHCPKRFASKPLLKQHQVRNHQEKKFKCPQCEMAFARNDIVRKHLQNKHRKDREEVDERPGESNGSGARSKPSNCRAGPDLEESDESESNWESGVEEAEQPERHAERRKIKIENCLPEDEQVSELDDSIEGRLKRIKREPEDAEGSRSSDESGNEDSDEFEESEEETDRKDEAVEHDPDRMEHDLDDPMEGCSKTIKSEFEEIIERAPIGPSDFEAYDFKELAAENMKRMKMESKFESEG